MPEGLPEDLGELQGEDTGLGQLARRVAAEAMEGADGDAPPSGTAAVAQPPDLQHLEVGLITSAAPLHYLTGRSHAYKSSYRIQGLWVCMISYHSKHSDKHCSASIT